MAGKGCVQQVQRNPGQAGQHPQYRVAQGARAHAPGGLEHDGRHGGFDACKQTRYQRRVAKNQIDPGQRNQQEQRRQNKQDTCHDAARAAVHQPAQVGGQLLRLRAGQHHAVVQRMQKAALRNPAPALHQFLVQKSDLTRRAAKADAADLQPKPPGLAQRYVHGCLRTQNAPTIRLHRIHSGHSPKRPAHQAKGVVPVRPSTKPSNAPACRGASAARM